MYATKSFCNVSAFIKNQPNVNSPIGELTTHAATFSRNTATFHSATIGGYDLINFSSKENEQKQIMRTAAVEQAIALVHEAVRMTLGTSGELYQDEVHRVLVQKAEALKANNVQTGRMISDGVRWVPRWISWSDTTDSRENEHIVWLSIDDFVVDYPEYEIIVVPPVDNLDSFFFPGSVVESTIRAITPTQMMERAENAKGQNPTTWRASEPYSYRDPVNTSRVIDVYWQTMGYGEAGNDPDLKRDALVSYILANSTRSREDWAVIFPDIFRRTEIVFVPMFDKYAAEARVFDHGIYSPIVDNSAVVKYARKGAPEYPMEHVIDNAQVFSFPYRSLAIASIGHIENRDGKVKLTDHYPDYMSVPTTSTDYGRMSVATQQWAEKLLELIILAESWTIATRLPKGIYRVKRGERTYISATINRVLMLVMVKSDIIAK